MSYSNLVLADRPLGYWGGPSINRNNLLSNNQYSLETSTTGWTALDNSSISRVTADSWVGSASLQITPASTSEAGFKIAPGSRIQLSYGRTYTMVARVKNTSGSRSARIRIEYFTTQNGSILSEPVRLGQEFSISSSEWTTIYHTEILPVGVSTNYFMSWGVITNAGLSTDRILVDGIQFFDGPLYSMYDEQYSNDATLRYYNYQKCKPIIFGGAETIKLDNSSMIEIVNNYKIFIKGAEDKSASIEFWFSLERPPSYRHNLLSIGSGISCYLEEDKVYIDYLGFRNFVRVSDWNRQHHLYFHYSNRQVSIYLNNSLKASVILGPNFQFDDIVDFIIPRISIGPSSLPYNLIFNPSFDLGTDEWISKNSTISIINSDSYSGNNCLQITKQAVNNSGCSTDAITTLDAYKTYTLSAYIKIPTGQPLGNIELSCNLYDSPDKTQLTNSYSENISITNNNWQLIDISFTTDLNDRVAEISIIQPVAGTAGSTFLVDAICLEKNIENTIWSDNSNNSDPLFISDITLYSKELTSAQIQKRIDYATIDVDNQLAIQKNADVIDLQYKNFQSINEINILDKINQLTIEGVVFKNSALYHNKINAEQVQYGLNGGTANISKDGLVLTGDAYLPISQPYGAFNVNSGTLRLQTKFDSTSGNGILLFIDGILNYYGMVIRKNNNKIQAVLLDDYNGGETLLCETSTLTSGNKNIALNFSGLYLSVKVNSEEFNSIAIPPLLDSCKITIGNIPQTSNAYPDAIRNFAIDKLTEFANINYLNTGRYMLRLMEDLSVSQKETIELTVSPLSVSNNTVLTINTAGDNLVKINNKIVKENINIPLFDYTTPTDISMSIELESDNSQTKYKVFSGANMAVFDSSVLNSSRGNYQLNHNSQSGSQLNEPFVIQTISSNVLSHDDNLGIRFIKNKSTGCKINNINDVARCLEFVFKINIPPLRNETYTIFDISGGSSVGLSLTKDGLVKNGTYTLYIDGQEVTNVSTSTIVPGEFYHLFVVFPSNLTSDIHLGKNKNLTNDMDGSIGKLNIYSSVPANTANFVLEKYQDILGVIVKKISGGIISFTDSELTQQYYRSDDGNYYEMINLPKIKIFDNS